MRAVTLDEARPSLSLDDIDDPEPGPHEVVLRVTECGICGSDLHIAAHLAPVGAVLGHEIAGTIEQLGALVDPARWTLGAAVTARPLIGCGTCPHCTRGRPDHCAAFALVGLDRPGGFAELTTVRADELFALPASSTIEDRALVEPLAVARRAVRRAGLEEGDTVAVLGAGPIGLAVIAWARHLGIEKIVASDPSATRRELAAKLGATLVLDPTADDLVETVTSGPGSPSVVFECSGRPGLIQQAMNLAAIEGRVTVVGICLTDDITYPYTGIHKELDVRYAIYYGREDFLDTIDALHDGTLDASAMVTEIIDLAALPERFARLGRDADGGKVIVRP